MNHKHGSYYKRLESLLYIPILAILDHLWRSEVLASLFSSPAKRGVKPGASSTLTSAKRVKMKRGVGEAASPVLASAKHAEAKYQESLQGSRDLAESAMRQE